METTRTGSFAGAMTSPTSHSRPVTFPPAALQALRCPHCSAGLAVHSRALRCPTGHSFDVARQGYVNLLGAGGGDSTEMVAARSEFLAAGHYAPLASAIASAAASPGLIVDAGTGPGYYLASVLASGGTGLGLDVSPAALRRAARAHSSLGAVVWDLWKPWPLASGSADVILNVFAPRNPAESARVLRPGGRLVVVTPAPSHLAELREQVEMLAVDDDKLARLDSSLAPLFTVSSRSDCTVPLVLPPADVRRVVHMGPNAYHVPASALSSITAPLAVTASFVVSVYRGEP
jgi:23S rRNA (guanine745-N1)-methyltransferase